MIQGIGFPFSFRIGVLLFFGFQMIVFLVLLIKRRSTSLKPSEIGNENVLKALLYSAFLVVLSSGTYSIVSGLRTDIFLIAVPIFMTFLILGTALENLSWKTLLSLGLITISLIFLSSYSITGFHPIGTDYPRFMAWAKRIIIDGGWTPGRYAEHMYYDNLLHALPALGAMLSLISGLNVLTGIEAFITLALTLTFALTVYIAVKNFSKSRAAGIVALILAFSVPPLTMLYVHPQHVNYVFYALFVGVLSIYFKEGSRRPSLIFITIIIFICSVIFHPTIFLSVIASVLVILLYKKINRKKSVPKVYGLAVTFFVICFSYWIYLDLLCLVIRPGSGFLSTLFRLLSGKTLLTTVGSRTYFTSYTPAYLAFAWTFVPALACAVILSRVGKLIKMFKCKTKDISIHLFFSLGGMILISLIFLDVWAVHVGSSRYFYTGFPVALIGAPLALSETLKKWRDSLSVLLSIALIVGFVSFSAVNSPTHSPDVYPKIRGQVGRKPGHWAVGETIIDKFPHGYQLEDHNLMKLAGPLRYFSKVRVMEGYYRYYPGSRVGPVRGHIYLYRPKNVGRKGIWLFDMTSSGGIEKELRTGKISENVNSKFIYERFPPLINYRIEREENKIWRIVNKRSKATYFIEKKGRIYHVYKKMSSKSVIYSGYKYEAAIEAGK